MPYSFPSVNHCTTKMTEIFKPSLRCYFCDWKIEVKKTNDFKYTLTMQVSAKYTPEIPTGTFIKWKFQFQTEEHQEPTQKLISHLIGFVWRFFRKCKLSDIDKGQICSVIDMMFMTERIMILDMCDFYEWPIKFAF
ncbi:C2 protein [Spinach severe curly top virus]|uniref:C2 protein n=1 Tax=Spinach severe curly top virus TaxID=873160 RepID=E0YA57_9GEMI|nr:C2 protein [Spinach severe curly top virus]ADM64624.2 C2 protein [Spinach severe curly top virus]